MLINGCCYCDPTHPFYEGDIIYNPVNGKYELMVESTEWSNYLDDFIPIRIDISYCPFCGRQLSFEECK